jgi:hypothetical protein
MKRQVTGLPWVSAVLALGLAANPVGWGFLDAAFVSSDQLGQNIARPVVLAAIGAVLLLMLAEYLLRRWLRHRSG